MTSLSQLTAIKNVVGVRVWEFIGADDVESPPSGVGRNLHGTFGSAKLPHHIDILVIVNLVHWIQK